MTQAQPNQSRRRLHAHAGSLHDLLSIIEKAVDASSLMTPWAQVESVLGQSNSADTLSKAKSLMEAHHYSGVPLLWEGQVKGIYCRHDPTRGPQFESVRPQQFVEPELGLIDLIRRMRDRQKVVVCVGTQTAPLGWLTYADFSKRPFRVLLFVIVAEVEFLLAEALDRAHSDDSWIDLLPNPGDSSDDARRELQCRKNQAAQWDVTMPLTTFAEIGHLIAAAGGSSLVRAMLDEEDGLGDSLKSLPDLRNRVAHVVKPVVAGPAAIKSVAGQIDQMLAWIKKWSERLESATPGGSDNSD